METLRSGGEVVWGWETEKRGSQLRLRNRKKRMDEMDNGRIKGLFYFITAHIKWDKKHKRPNI